MTQTNTKRTRPGVAAVITAGFFAVALVAAGVFMCGCGNDSEEARLQKEREWALHNFTEGKTPPPKPIPLPEDLVIDIPESVKQKYVGVELAVGNRKTREITKFTVKLGESAEVPGTDYSVQVGEYIPTWLMSGGKVTSKSDEPVDPAVRATIYRSGEKVFDGFLFQRHRTPSFMTEEHVIGLVGAVTR